jgi:hypothetical protein
MSELETWTAQPALPSAQEQMEDGEVQDGDDDVIFLSERPTQGSVHPFASSANVPEIPALPVYALVCLSLKSHASYDGLKKYVLQLTDKSYS